eukprot:CAMPEP_0117447904 /NCGR_PEP_ID=MMETSP0759-20121206/7117_1 /TAXON_ID=63605 /ORGANISM="Percolomonas cosmopolitus, Strain WS" /LENGTH=946 /DNA_ID=CAMNT_0005240257 /DNA_START=162 /DNA_END=2998 /DNA_ORIENTATION=-
MGQFVSFDLQPVPYQALLSKATHASFTHSPPTHSRHNVKLFIITQQNKITPVRFDDLLQIDEEACYIVVHFYCLDGSGVNNSNPQSTTQHISATTTNGNTTLSGQKNAPQKSLFHHTYEQLTQNVQPQSLTHPFSIPAKYHTLHLLNGVASSSQTQAFAISQCLHLERLFMDLEKWQFVQMMQNGDPVSLDRMLSGVSGNESQLAWKMDVPLLSKVPKSLVANYMQLYSSCDLFRVIINDCTYCVEQRQKMQQKRQQEQTSTTHVKNAIPEPVHDMWLQGLSMHQILNLPPPVQLQKSARRSHKNRSVRNDNNDWLLMDSPRDLDSPRFNRDSVPHIPPVPLSRLNPQSVQRSARSSSSNSSSSARTNKSSPTTRDGSLSTRIPVLNNLMMGNNEQSLSARSHLTVGDYTDDDFTASTVSTARSTSSARNRNQLIGNIRPRPDDVLEREHGLSKSARSSHSDSSPRSSRSSSSSHTGRRSQMNRQVLIPKMRKFSLDLDSVMANSAFNDPYGKSAKDSARSSASSGSFNDLIPNPSMSGAELVMHFRKKVSNVHNDFLFVGSDRVAKNLDQLKKVGITHIINAAKMACDVYFPNEFEYLVLSLYDSGTESILGLFFRVIDFVEKARREGGKVLVHCYEGVSRSTTLAIAYIMWKTRKGFNDVMEEVKRKRGSASPNAGFIVQLLQWEKMLKEPHPISLYRISPLNDRFFEHKELVPHLCNSNVLDSRTCFVLFDSKTNRIFVWEGRNSLELMRPKAEEFALHLKVFFGNDDTQVVCFPEADANKYPEFFRAVKNVSILCPPRRRNQGEEMYPELEFLDTQGGMEDESSVANMQQETNIDDDHNSIMDDDASTGLYDAPAELIEYPNWESLENFDSDDLYDDAVFVLKPFDKPDTLYVWIGRSVTLDDEETDSAQEFGKLVANRYMQHNGGQYSEIIVVEDGEEEGT